MDSDSTSNAPLNDSMHVSNRGAEPEPSLVTLTMRAVQRILNAQAQRDDAEVSPVSSDDAAAHGADESRLRDTLMPPQSFNTASISNSDLAPFSTSYFSIPPETSVSPDDMGPPSEPGSTLVVSVHSRQMSRKDFTQQQQQQVTPLESDTNVPCDGASPLPPPRTNMDFDANVVTSPQVVESPRNDDGAQSIINLPEVRALAAALEKRMDGISLISPSLLALEQGPDQPPSVSPTKSSQGGTGSSSEGPAHDCPNSPSVAALFGFPSLDDAPRTWWFRSDVCSFPVSRSPGARSAVLNAAETQFALNCAFHCPVKLVAHMYQAFLHALDVKNLLPRGYRNLLQRCERHSSLRHAEHFHSSLNRSDCELRCVPPPSTVLAELCRYLDLMNAAVGNTSIPRHVSGCCHMLRAAMTRRQVLGSIFLEMGEVCNYYQVMSVFPTLLWHHHRTMQFLLLSEGPLQLDMRFKIAIMAASRHRCEYLVRRFATSLMVFAEDASAAERFLSDGQDEKLELLKSLIAHLAHVPWQVSTSEIDTLMKTERWYIPELVHAVCIITTVLALSGLVMGLATPAEVSTSVSVPAAVCAPRPIPQLPLQLHSQASADDVTMQHSTESSGVNFFRFAGADDVVSIPRISRSTPSSVPSTSINEGTFSWKESGGPLVEQYYPGFADLLTEEMAAVSHVQKLQDGGDMVRKFADINPALVWRSLRLYLLNLFGVVVEDFSYTSINQILTRGVKTFVQKSAVYPERLCMADLGDWARTAATGPSSSASTVQSVQRTPNLTSSDDAPEAAEFPRPVAGDMQPLVKNEDRKWFIDEVVLALVSIVTFETRREGVLLLFLSAFSQYLASV